MKCALYCKSNDPTQCSVPLAALLSFVQYIPAHPEDAFCLLFCAGARVGADVPAGAAHQGGGVQDGAVRRRRRRALRRLPLLPQGGACTRRSQSLFARSAPMPPPPPPPPRMLPYTVSEFEQTVRLSRCGDVCPGPPLPDSALPPDVCTWRTSTPPVRKIWRGCAGTPVHYDQTFRASGQALLRGAGRGGVPPRVPAQDHAAAPVGRAARQQVHHGLGHRGRSVIKGLPNTLLQA